MKKESRLRRKKWIQGYKVFQYKQEDVIVNRKRHHNIQQDLTANKNKRYSSLQECIMYSAKKWLSKHCAMSQGFLQQNIHARTAASRQTRNREERKRGEKKNKGS